MRIAQSQQVQQNAGSECQQSCSIGGALGRLWSWLTTPTPEARQAEIESRAWFIFSGMQLERQKVPNLPEMTYEQALASSKWITEYFERVDAMTGEERWKLHDDAMRKFL